MGTGLFNSRDVIVGSQLEMDSLESLKSETSSQELETAEVAEAVNTLKED